MAEQRSWEELEASFASALAAAQGQVVRVMWGAEDFDADDPRVFGSERHGLRPKRKLSETPPPAGVATEVGLDPNGGPVLLRRLLPPRVRGISVRVDDGSKTEWRKFAIDDERRVLAQVVVVERNSEGRPVEATFRDFAGDHQRETYDYDAKGRVERVAVSSCVSDQATPLMVLRAEYGATGRLEQLTEVLHGRGVLFGPGAG